MTPKEKAIELINKMRLFYGEYLDANNEPKNHYRIQRSNAKQCALICVDEAILYHPMSTIPDERNIEFHNFWNEVKKEIENL